MLNLKRLTAGLGTLALCAVVAACGSSSSSNSASSSTSSGAGTSASGSTSQFDSAVSQAAAPKTQWPGPNGAPKSVPKGKTIYVITCSSQGNGCVRAAAGATQAASLLGWSVKTIDGKGDPATWNAGINSAIAAHAAGIVLDAVPPPLVGDAVTKAKAAGIPLVSVFNPKPSQPGSVFAYVTPDHSAQGTAMADWVASDSKGQAKIILVEDNEFPEIKQRTDAFQAEIKKCSGCKIDTVLQSQIGTMAQQVPGEVTSALQSHPDVTYVVGPYDSNALFESEGVQQAGKAATVKVSGYEGDAAAIAAIRKGQTFAATIADPAEWMGWSAIDEFRRALTKQPAQDVPVSWRLITKANVPSGANYVGDVAFASHFKTLWGVK